MITENLLTLKIHKLTQAQYNREFAAGNIDDNALYLIPNEDSDVDLSNYITQEELDKKGYLTSYTETDPTVPDWAKAKTKPTYTADEVGALPNTSTLGDLSDDSEHRTVTDTEKESWNSKSDFSGSYNDLTNLPTGLATESYVDTKVASLVDSAPETLNTLNELAAALGDDPNFATTIATQVGNKADLSSLEALQSTVNDKQDKITGTAGQFVIIGEDGNLTTTTIQSADGVSF